MATMRYENPFPGMNPYLEQPRFWPGLLNDLIAQMRTSLGPQLPPQYRMEIDERYELDVALPVSGEESKDIVPDLSATTGRASSGEILVKEPAAPVGSVLVTNAGTRKSYFLGGEARSGRPTAWFQSRKTAWFQS